MNDEVADEAADKRFDSAVVMSADPPDVVNRRPQDEDSLFVSPEMNLDIDGYHGQDEEDDHDMADGI